MKVNIDRVINDMKKYLDIPSPGGYTDNAVLEVKKDFDELGIESTITTKGGLIATIPGENDEHQITIAAHIDTLGAMVKEITADGKLRYFKIGGGCSNSIEGENCIVITSKEKKVRGSIAFDYSSTHIHGIEKSSIQRSEKNMYVRIDEKINSKQDVLDLGIKVGDFICMDTRFEVTDSGFIKSRYIDNKMAVAIVFEIARYLKENNLKPSNTIHFYISNFEEINHGITKALPEKTKEIIAIDIAPVGEGQTTTEDGVTIIAKDFKTVYDLDIKKELMNICEENNIKYNIDLFERYGSDASQAIMSGHEVRIAAIGPGTDASHHYERTHIEGIENTLKLLIHYVTK